MDVQEIITLSVQWSCDCISVFFCDDYDFLPTWYCFVFVRFIHTFLFCFVFSGSRQRSTMTHWRSGMGRRPPPPWLANTMAPRHLISWFPHPTSCSCCSPQTTVVLQQASASDMKVRLIKQTEKNVFRKHFTLTILILLFLCFCVIFRCENGVWLVSRSWYPSQRSSPWWKLFHWFSCLIYVWLWIYP